HLRAERFGERDRVRDGLLDAARGVRPRHRGGIAEKTNAAATIARHAKIVDRLEERVFRRVDDFLDVARHLSAEATDLLDLGARRTAGIYGCRRTRNRRVDAPVQPPPARFDVAVAARHEVERSVPAG